MKRWKKWGFFVQYDTSMIGIAFVFDFSRIERGFGFLIGPIGFGWEATGVRS